MIWYGLCRHKYAYARSSSAKLTLSPKKCADIEIDEHTDNCIAFVSEQFNGLSGPKVYVDTEGGLLHLGGVP